MLRNSAHSNVAYLFDEADRRLPDEDTVTLVTGFIGENPNAFYLVKTADLSAFVDTVKDLGSAERLCGIDGAVRPSSHRHTFLVLQ